MWHLHLPTLVLPRNPLRLEYDAHSLEINQDRDGGVVQRGIGVTAVAGNLELYQERRPYYVGSPYRFSVSSLVFFFVPFFCDH
mgnify:CR=1 FL=1